VSAQGRMIVQFVRKELKIARTPEPAVIPGGGWGEQKGQQIGRLVGSVRSSGSMAASVELGRGVGN
jgi:hypothetical protein